MANQVLTQPYWYCLVAGCLLLVACVNQTPDAAQGAANLHQPLSQDSGFRETLQQQTRNGRLYAGYAHVLSVDAVYKSVAYRQRYLQEYTTAYYLSQSGQQQLLSDQQQAYNQFFEFIILLYTEQPNPVKIGQPDSEWQVFLKDNADDLLSAVSVAKMNPDDYETIFLKKHFSKLDRWARVYKVKFPKLSLESTPDAAQTEEVVQQRQNFQLIISGIQGKILLRWDGINMFLQNTNQLSLEH